MSRTFLFIVNPAAGSAWGPSVRHRLERVLNRTNISYELKETTETGEATNMAERVPEKFSHVVAVGGDGTVNEVVNGLIDTRVGFGVIPTGSGNDFAKAIGVPEQLEDAVDLLQHGGERFVDVGRFGSRYFVNGVGMGLDGAVGHQFHGAHRILGGLGYALSAFREAHSYPGFQVDISLPGERYQGRALFCSVSNGPVQGGYFRLGPDASVVDGLLDVQLTRYLSPVRRFINGPRWMFGGQEQLREVEIKQASTFTVKLEKEVPAHVDGEPISMGKGTHPFEVREGELNVICSDGV